MIGLAFELIEWSIKLMIIAFVLMMRLMFSFAKVLCILIAALTLAVVAAWERHQAHDSAA